MNRSKLADLSEILSSIAIVVTLVYLTLEVRQNTQALRAQTSQAVLESSHSELGMLLENPDVAVMLGQQGPLETPEAHAQVDALLALQFRTREFAWLQYQAGSIDQAQWETEVAVLRGILDSSLARTWWERMGEGVVGPEFATYVETLMGETEATDRIWSYDWSLPQTGG